jgi:hypothetical protein
MNKQTQQLYNALVPILTDPESTSAQRLSAGNLIAACLGLLNGKADKTREKRQQRNARYKQAQKAKRTQEQAVQLQDNPSEFDPKKALQELYKRIEQANQQANTRSEPAEEQEPASEPTSISMDELEERAA